jgi:apolipoprotein N-acyltransferase
MIANAAEFLCRSAGWRRAALAILLGAVAALALPPFHIVPALVPVFTGLVWLLEGDARAGRRFRHGLLTGFWFGLGHFALGVHWIAEPLLVDAARTAWLIPAALPGLAAVLALFPAFSCAVLVRWWGGASVAARVFALAGLWTLFEIARAYLFTGFPWNLIGYAWSDAIPVMQTSAFVGVFGLGALTIVAAAMPALLVAPDMSAGRRWATAALATIVLPALLWAGGAARMGGGGQADGDFVADVRLRIVQANIAQRDKWNPDLRAGHLDRHLALSAAPGDAAPTHVIWPETAVPFLLANDVLARVRAAQAAPPGGALLTGSVRAAFLGGVRQVRNAMLVIDGQADVRRVYDKSHLVPFGEYVPLRGVLPVERIVPGQGDFVPGDGRAVLDVPGLPAVTPLICYEAIFPGRVIPRGERPGWLLNLTNDAWFGTFAGPQQHFAIAAARAVEEGLPMVRAANTGISAVVDPYGRVIARLGVGEAGVLDARLPHALEPTVYARWGDAVPIILSLLFLGGAAWASRRRESA